MKKTVENIKKPGNFMITLFLNSTIGILFTLIITLICSGLVSTEAISPDMIPILSGACVFLGALISGLFSAKKLGHPIYIALAQGVLNLLILYLIGAIIFGRMATESSVFLVPLFSFIGAICGGVFSVFFSSAKR